MASHMRKLGHEVAVVTTSSAGHIEGEHDVVRTLDLFASPGLRRLLRAPPSSAAGYSAAVFASPPLHERVLVPDPKILGWLPGALAATRRLLRDREFDCLITASPFESTHLIGLALGSRRPPWITDLRDGWTFEPWRPALPWSRQRQLDRWLERQVLTRADAVTVVPSAIGGDVERRFGRKAHHVTNGWDPDLEPTLEGAIAPNPRPDRTTLVYTGTLWKIVGQDPSPLFNALVRLRSEDPAAYSQLEFLIAGPLSAAEARRLRQFGLDGVLRHVGHLSRAQAVALQRRADALLLLTSAQVQMVTGKIVEYLASGRPILALAGGDDAARLIQETGTGVVVARDDEPKIMQALRDLISGSLQKQYRPRGLEAYRYPAPAKKMLEVVQETIRLSRSPLRRHAGSPGS
jgi:glycosyltransferase involved in cell wall biosynthesis